MSGSTGIEIQVGVSPGQRVIGKALHAVHLDKLVKWVGKMQNAIITLDGEQREEPLYQAHFVEAAPGEHTVEVSLKPKPKSDLGLTQYVFSASYKATVEAGKVTVLLYTPKDGGGASLTLVETRSA